MQGLTPIACLIGPTASGKSSLALQWALHHRQARGQAVEIISLDSTQVYRGLDIGSAKPTAQERAQVAHHLLDCCDPEDSYSVAQCHADTLQAALAIQARGHRPLIVGGTMLYFKALWQGLDDLPSAPESIRQAIGQQAQVLGWPALHAQLAQVDPQTAGRLDPNDAQRISRALEVHAHTGQSLSHWIAQSQREGRGLPALPLRVLALLPSRRDWLHERIARRFEAMVAAGLLEEVRLLQARPGLRADHPSMRSVGYRQAWEHLKGQTDQTTFLQKGIEASRQLAKRQITWLRSFEQTAQVAQLEYRSVDPCELDEHQLMTVCGESFGRS